MIIFSVGTLLAAAGWVADETIWAGRLVHPDDVAAQSDLERLALDPRGKIELDSRGARFLLERWPALMETYPEGLPQSVLSVRRSSTRQSFINGHTQTTDLVLATSELDGSGAFSAVQPAWTLEAARAFVDNEVLTRVWIVSAVLFWSGLATSTVVGFCEFRRTDNGN